MTMMFAALEAVASAYVRAHDAAPEQAEARAEELLDTLHRRRPVKRLRRRVAVIRSNLHAEDRPRHPSPTSRSEEPGPELFRHASGPGPSDPRPTSPTAPDGGGAE